MNPAHALTIDVHGQTELGTIRIAPLLLDRDARRLFVRGREVPVARVEFELIELLMDRPRHVIERHVMKQVAWNGHCSDRTLDAAVSRLRRKVLQAGGPRIAESVRGIGYRLGLPCPPRIEG